MAINVRTGEEFVARWDNGAGFSSLRGDNHLNYLELDSQEAKQELFDLIQKHPEEYTKIKPYITVPAKARYVEWLLGAQLRMEINNGAGWSNRAGFGLGRGEVDAAGGVDKVVKKLIDAARGSAINAELIRDYYTAAGFTAFGAYNPGTVVDNKDLREEMVKAFQKYTPAPNAALDGAFKK